MMIICLKWFFLTLVREAPSKLFWGIVQLVLLTSHKKKHIKWLKLSSTHTVLKTKQNFHVQLQNSIPSHEAHTFFLLQMTLLTRQLLTLAMFDQTTNIIMIAVPPRATADQQTDIWKQIMFCLARFSYVWCWFTHSLCIVFSLFSIASYFAF